jgi:hypothetical protein
MPILNACSRAEKKGRHRASKERLRFVRGLGRCSAQAKARPMEGRLLIVAYTAAVA